MAKKDKSSKRKARENDVETATGISSEIIQHKSLDDNDLAQVTADLDEPTMGDKLLSLKLEENNEANNHEISAKPPSADSVYILLKQALRADDRALLIDCLLRQDKKVITNSLSLLNPSDVIRLLQSLVPITQLRGGVLVCALPWLKSLLVQHAGSIMSQQSSVDAVNSLYQIIESRVSTFNASLQLSSCLDLVYAETIDDGEEDNDMITPVIFEDNDDESDDEGSQDSMEIETVED